MTTNPERTSSGMLRISAVNIQGNFPIQNAKVTISYKGEPTSAIEQLQADNLGQTKTVSLPAPPVELSLEPGIIQPCPEYNLTVKANGFDPLMVSGTEILTESAAIQLVSMTPQGEGTPPEDPIVIPDHTLYRDYPPKITEAEIKSVNENGKIVLGRVVVLQTIVAHDGTPTDSTARDYCVPYRDYIRDVASSEIYSAWSRVTIAANVLATMSFTLNRVYTEWYGNWRYGFTITSSTAFDHKWICGRNIFESISWIVGEIFDSYLSRPGVRQPILTRYCNGHQVQCPNWMIQWGSYSLGEQRYSPIEILRHFYDSSIYISTTEQIAGVPASWPGNDLIIGDSGGRVGQVQEQLDTITTVCTAIPRVTPDGVYGPRTAKVVRKFQSVFGLPQIGVVDLATWYRMSHICVRIARIAELVQGRSQDKKRVRTI